MPSSAYELILTFHVAVSLCVLVFPGLFMFQLDLMPSLRKDKLTSRSTNVQLFDEDRQFSANCKFKTAAQQSGFS